MDKNWVSGEVLRKLPTAIHWYLEQTVFPTYTQHQRIKLSSSGQELGGAMLFPSRLGFSGTPSDLLPLELGTCNYAAGDDAKMLHILTSTDNVTYNPLPLDWSVDSLLGEIANASPAFHALIDTGALVTGYSNLEVAAALLDAACLEVEVRRRVGEPVRSSEGPGPQKDRPGDRFREFGHQKCNTAPFHRAN